MLLVIESRTDLTPVPTEAAARSTETALRNMGWPFPVDDAVPTPRRPIPIAASASNVVALKPAPVSPPAPTPTVEPRRIAARRALPAFGLELAEAR